MVEMKLPYLPTSITDLELAIFNLKPFFACNINYLAYPPVL